jgi:diguanylate cyclase (GGDEF)-like protein/PAS domain S-box-containing protein
MTRSREAISTQLRGVSIGAGAVVSGVGIAVLVGGWWLNLESVRQPLQDFSAMRAATATALTLSGLGVVAAGLNWPRWVPAACGLVVGALGTLALGMYALGRPKSVIESVFALRIATDESVPGRIAINSAVCLVLVGAGLVLLALGRADGFRQACGVTVFLVAYSAIMGFLMSSAQVSGGILPTYTAMAPHTAVPLLLVGAGLTFVSLDRGWGRIFADPMAGGSVIRTYLPILLVLFLAAARGLSLTSDVGDTNDASGAVVLAAVAVVVLVGLLVLSFRLERLDAEREELSTDIEARIADRTLDLRQTTSLLRARFDEAPNGVALVGIDGRVLDANRALSDILGMSRPDLMTVTLDSLRHPDDSAQARDFVAAAITGGDPAGQHDSRMLRPDGGAVWVRESVGVVRDDVQQPVVLVCTFVDVTAEIAAERALVEQEELLRVVLDTSVEATMRLDRDLRVEYVNKRVEQMSGLPLETWVGKTLLEMGYPTELVDTWDAEHRYVLDTGQSVTYEFEIDNAEGHRWYEATAAGVPGTDGAITHLIVTAHDVTGRKDSEIELLRLAMTDPLTGLPNRNALLSEITRALSAGRRHGVSTGVMMIDLDRFKYINDSLGHAFGDALLVAASARLGATMRGGDLVSRHGGDEFVVVMRDLEEPSEAVLAAWRVVKAFREPFLIDGSEIFTTASVGVALTAGGADPDDLVREADTAMYVAKEEGRDRVSVFNEDLRATATRRLNTEAELRRALERGELAVWYQPEVDLVTGSMVAVEALLRWHHPDGGVRTAAEFIDIAEDTGMIADIGRWVMEQACADAARWARERPGRRLTVRFNLAAIQLGSEGLLADLDTVLEACALAPDRLCVEITETALLRETGTVHRNLDGIRARGIRIAADDFGTGYASLAYLRQYPVDVLKIDQSFITNVTDNDVDHRLVAGVIALAGHLGISVTAEGVESIDQADVLRRLGCPSAQGFLFSRAVPREQVDDLFDMTFPASRAS